METPSVRDEDRQRIEEIIGGMACPKGFHCAASGFEDLCKARSIGQEHYLECQEATPNACTFALAFGLAHLCQCPLRVYLAQHLRR
jgi:hypothetical protein